MGIRRIVFSTVDIVSKIVLVMLAVSFISRGTKLAYDVGLQIFDQRPLSAVDTRTVTVVVSGADSVMDIGRQLEEKGLIEDARLFVVQERLSVYHELIGAGTYELSPSMTPDEMIAIMAAPTIAAKKSAEEAEKGAAAASSPDQEEAEDAPEEENQEEGASDQEGSRLDNR